MISRRVIGAAAIAVVAPLAFIVAPAHAVPAPSSTITAVPDDSTPASGQTFHVSGMFTAQGAPADHLVVKMQAMIGDKWVQLTGATMSTHSDGTYTMRVTLSMKGERELRAVGVVPGPARNAFKPFEVTVH